MLLFINNNKKMQALEFDPYDGKFIPPEKRGTDIDYFRGTLMNHIDY